MKLNLGCGYKKKEGWMNIDISPKVNPDKVVDISGGLPFSNNSITEFYDNHTLQHIPKCKLNFVLSEIFRTAKDNAILEMNLPFDNIQNRSSIDNHSTFTWNSFNHLIKGHLRDYYHNAYLDPLHKEPNILIKMFFCLFPFLNSEVNFKFRIVKGEVN